MIVLDSSKDLQMQLSSTSVLVVATAHYVDTSNIPAYQVTAAGGVAGTPVAIVSSPGGGIQKLIQHVEIFNGDASTQTVTILLGTQIVLTTSLSSNATLQYTTNGGWVVPTTTSSYFPSGGW
jgi:hypothetical protein